MIKGNQGIQELPFQPVYIRIYLYLSVYTYVYQIKWIHVTNSFEIQLAQIRNLNVLVGLSVTHLYYINVQIYLLGFL